MIEINYNESENELLKLFYLFCVAQYVCGQNTAES